MALFVYGFAKSKLDNIGTDERDRFKQAANHILALTETQIQELLKLGDFEEVMNE